MMIHLRTTIVAAACALVFWFPSASRAQDLDQYGGFKDVVAEPTGFFYTQKIDGRWWLVTPDGHGMFCLGLSHPITGMSQAAITFAYGGDQEEWLRDSVRKMRDLGFNCVWSGPYSTERVRFGVVDQALAEDVYREAGIPHAVQIPLIKHGVEMRPGEIRPDVFSDEFKQFVSDEVIAVTSRRRDDPWVIGYYYGYAAFQPEDLWINQTLSRPPGSAGRERLIDVLEQRYAGDIGEFNAVYGTQASSFQDLRTGQALTIPSWFRAVKAGAPLPARPGSKAIFEDAEALLGEIAEEFFKTAYTRIREHDPHHMVLGSYVRIPTFSEEIWRRIAPYIDVLAPQHIDEQAPLNASVADIGKPALVSDQIFGNVYPRLLQGAAGAPGPVPEAIDREVLYDMLMNRLAGDPDIVGLSYCGVLFEQSHWRRPYDRGQPSFFTIDGEPIEPLTTAVREANHRALSQVGTPLPREILAQRGDAYFETLAAYRLIMRQRNNYLREQAERNGSQ